MNYLAFDLGASSGKMFLGEFDGKRLSIKPVHSFPNAAVQMADGLYWDFISIYRNVVEAAVKVSAETEIKSLAIDSYNNDVSFINKNGEMLFPVRSYRDVRTAVHEEATYKKMSKKDLYMCNGNQIALYNTLPHLAAMVENGQSYVFDNCWRMLHIADLIGYYLTGEAKTEYTLASTTQMFDYFTNDWDDRVLKAFDIPRHMLAPISMPGSVVGHTTKKFCELNGGIKGFDFVSACEHDTGSAYLAAPLTGEFAIISSGTWALVGTEHDKPIITETAYLNNIANEGGAPGKHHRLIKNVMGSWILQESLKEFKLHGKDYGWAEIDAAIADAEPFKYLIDVDETFFFHPGNMVTKIRNRLAEVYGKAPETDGEIFRCIKESLAMKYRYAIEKLEETKGVALNDISIIGGGSKDAMSCQFTANACGKRVVGGPADASSLGNILTQMLASGEIASIEEGKEIVNASFDTKEYLPQDTAVWEEQYQAFKERYSLK